MLLDDLTIPILTRLEQHDENAALAIALDWPSFGLLKAIQRKLSRILFRFNRNRLTDILVRMKGPMLQVIRDQQVKFVDMVSTLESGFWGEWLKYRFGMEPFLPIYALTTTMTNHGYVLEVGSGAGHSTFVLSRFIDGTHIIGTDNTFSFLYIAKKYFVPKGNYVCLDANNPLPFPNGFFSHVVCSDTFQFINSKIALANETKRVMHDDGHIIFSHIHNNMFVHEFAGRPLSPAGYYRLFEDLHVRIFPNQELTTDLFTHNRIDLSRCWTPESLNAFEGLSLIAAKNDSTFCLHQDPWKRSLACIKTPVINPAYSVKLEHGRYSISRRKMSKEFSKLQQVTSIDMADQLDLRDIEPTTAYLLDLKEQDPEYFLKLMRKLVIIDVPAHYI